MIVVTGLMRSGTSPIAQMLHQMGVEMGSFMRFPIQSTVSHFEWEDAPLAEPLVRHLMNKVELDVPDLLRNYILGREGRWGVKTPFLLPFLRDFRQIALGLGSKLRIVLTDRDYSETVKSIEKQYAHLPDEQRGNALREVLALQERLREALFDVPQHALVVRHADLQSDPKGVAEQLAKVVGIDVDLDAATRGILGRD